MEAIVLAPEERRRLFGSVLGGARVLGNAYVMNYIRKQFHHPSGLARDCTDRELVELSAWVTDRLAERAKGGDSGTARDRR